MTVGELRKILQYYEDKVEIRFKDPVRGKLWPLEGRVEVEMVWESIYDDYNGRVGEAGKTAMVLVKKDG
jgi:hypothetical protein